MSFRFFALLALIGTSTSAFAAPKKAPAPEVLAATHGYVRASIPQWEFAADLRLISLDRNRSAKPATTVKLLKLETRHGIRSWEGWLPAGRYVLAADVNAQNVKRATVDEAGQPFEPVTVRAGQMTDLGVLYRVPVGNFEYQLVPTADGGVQEENAQALARVQSVLSSRDVIPWRALTLPKIARFAERQSTTGLVEGIMQSVERDRQARKAMEKLRSLRLPEEFLALAKTLTPPTSEEPAADADGNLYYGADLGQIRVRDPKGQWTARDTGTGVEVTAVEFHVGRLVAGNLRGQLLMSQDGGTSWTLASSLSPREVIVDIDRAGGHWIVLTAPFDDEPGGYYLPLEYPPGESKAWALKPTVRIYGASRDDLSDLTVYREFEVKKQPALLARQPGTPDAIGGFPLGGDYLVHTYTGIYRLSPPTRAWAEVPIPTPFSTLVRLSADGKYLSVVSPYKGARHDYSTDGGKTWTRHARPVSWTYDIVLDSETQGRSSKATIGRFARTLEFYELDASSRDWKKVYEAPAECIRMLRDAAFEQRYCVSRHGSILSLTQGAWRPEFVVQ